MHDSGKDNHIVHLPLRLLLLLLLSMNVDEELSSSRWNLITELLLLSYSCVVFLFFANEYLHSWIGKYSADL